MSEEQFRELLIAQLNTLNTVLAMDAMVRSDNEALSEALGETLGTLKEHMAKVLTTAKEQK